MGPELKLLKDQAAILSDNPWPHEAVIVLEGDGSGHRPNLYAGRMEIAQRVMSCWNVQLGVEINVVRRYQVPAISISGSKDALRDALEKMVLLHDHMMKKINHAKSFYDADLLREMNETPILARKILGTKS